MNWLDAQSVLETGKTAGASIAPVQVSKPYADMNVSRCTNNEDIPARVMHALSQHSGVRS